MVKVTISRSSEGEKDFDFEKPTAIDFFRLAERVTDEIKRVYGVYDWENDIFVVIIDVNQETEDFAIETIIFSLTPYVIRMLQAKLPYSLEKLHEENDLSYLVVYTKKNMKILYGISKDGLKYYG